MNAARLSVVIALVVVILKTLAWQATNSVALLADALESLVNVAAAAAALLALRFAHQPPDEEHPFGHGKVEYFSAGFEGGLILLAAAGIVWQAGARFLTTPDEWQLAGLPLGLGASAVATALNMTIAWWLIRVGRACRSPALEADGKHVASDVVTTLGSWVALGLAWYTGWWVLDPIVGVLIALHVAYVGVRVVRDSVGGLIDSALPPDQRVLLAQVIEQNLEGALEAHDIRTRVVADTIFLEFHLVVPGEMTVSESHTMCNRIEGALTSNFPGMQATIHVEPEEEAHSPLRPGKERLDPEESPSD